jgi:hypothetical protein
MPELINKIECVLVDNNTDNVSLFNTIECIYFGDDFINTINLVAFVQNLDEVDETSSLQNPLNYGLVNLYNKKMVTLNINY